MTVESTLRPGHHDQTQVSETNRNETVHDENKRAHLIESVSRGMLNVAMESPSLRTIPAKMSEFDLSDVHLPNTYKPGDIRVGLFRDGLWVRVSTSGLVVNALHKFMIYRDADPRYHVSKLNVETDEPMTPEVMAAYRQRMANAVDGDMVGAEQIAMVDPEIVDPDIGFHMGQVMSTFNAAAKARWQLNHGHQALSDSDLRHAYEKRQRSSAT